MLFWDQFGPVGLLIRTEIPQGWFFGHSVEGQRVAPLVFIHKKFLKGGRHFPFHPQLYLHNIWQRMFCKTWIHFRESYPAHFITSRQIWKWRTLFHCSNSRHGPRLTWRKNTSTSKWVRKGTLTTKIPISENPAFIVTSDTQFITAVRWDIGLILEKATAFGETYRKDMFCF